jgi:hypothetical protein
LNAILLALTLSAAPVPNAPTTDLPPTFLPEGLEWDAAHARFLIGGVRAHRIASVDPPDGIVYVAWTRFAHAFENNPATAISA